MVIMMMVLTRLRKCSALERVSRLMRFIPLDEHQALASAQATFWVALTTIVMINSPAPLGANPLNMSALPSCGTILQ